jgi:redox-sensitive bicupin YhaK (pirin superfamily)
MSEVVDTPNSPRASARHPVQITDSRTAKVGPLTVRRALPTRGRRMVGAWCFADHMGPETLSVEKTVDIAPHPHQGLQTVTWLFSGEFLHRDSLGVEQLIRPGQLNLMTAGFGVAHSEENPSITYGQLHGIQLWVAQPDRVKGRDRDRHRW